MIPDSGRYRRWREVGAIQDRFERSVAGQVIISAIVVMILLIGVIWSLPASMIQRSVAPPMRPAAVALGLDQDWGVFAPDPPRAATTIEVRVLVDGDAARRTWRLPRAHPVSGQYSWYRWQKLKESVLTPSSGLDLAEFAHWVVRDVTRSTENPTYVEVVELVNTLPPPGSATTTSQHFHRVVYREHLSGRP